MSETIIPKNSAAGVASQTPLICNISGSSRIAPSENKKVGQNAITPDTIPLESAVNIPLA